MIDCNTNSNEGRDSKVGLYRRLYIGAPARWHSRGRWLWQRGRRSILAFDSGRYRRDAAVRGTSHMCWDQAKARYLVSRTTPSQITTYFANCGRVGSASVDLPPRFRMREFRRRSVIDVSGGELGVSGPDSVSEESVIESRSAAFHAVNGNDNFRTSPRCATISH